MFSNVELERLEFQNIPSPVSKELKSIVFKFYDYVYEKIKLPSVKISDFSIVIGSPDFPSVL
jgi:hypothetical protein